MKKYLSLMGIMVLTILLSACGAKKEGSEMLDHHTDLFGENVYFFSPEDDPKEIQEILDEMYTAQETNQFGDNRYALYFMPGTYDENLAVHVGYYMQVAGLGTLPTDTVIPSLDCYARWLGDDTNHNATCNFWRSVENMEIQGNKTIWAVSQATDMRRVKIDGSLYLHDEYGWASGGFLADSVIERMVESGSQQQWLSRNNSYTTWINQNWNIVFMGDDPDGIPNGTWPNYSYTTVDTTEVIREKPYLTYSNGTFYVFVPSVKTRSQGPGWSEESREDGTLIPISDFYVAREEKDDASSLQIALDEGKHLFFTPGIYDLESPLTVKNDGTILLGSGLATLRVAGGSEVGCLQTMAAEVTISGLLFDAGSYATKTLLSIEKPETDISNKEHFTLLSDVYFRVGGGETDAPSTTDSCLMVDDDFVVGDNLWVWRADHGDQVAWDKNVTKNGVIINGDDVTMYALMVEHFHEYQTVWNGERGRLVMYQSEVPYDVPSPEAWKSHDGTMDGFASVYVAADVTSFSADGIGIYLYNRDAVVPLFAAMETPKGDEIDIRHIITVLLNGNPGMYHVINDTGGAVMHTGDKQMVLHYKGGEDIRFD